jgi:hypothetical protein
MTGEIWLAVRFSDSRGVESHQSGIRIMDRFRLSTNAGIKKETTR